jgi:hypothetical protein
MSVVDYEKGEVCGIGNARRWQPMEMDLELKLY